MTRRLALVVALSSLALTSLLSVHAADPSYEAEGKLTRDVRSQSARKIRVAGQGGIAKSEEAVKAGLAWLAAHEMQDGGWSFDHGVSNQHAGGVNNPGGEKSTIGATSLVLLTFLAAGETHKEGAYRETMERGLKYLVAQRKQAQAPRENATFEAWSAIALCEALLLSQDKLLAEPAQASVARVIALQDQETGGWRALPGQPCDAVTTAWAVQALKSARLAKIEVHRDPLAAADKFLDTLRRGEQDVYGLTEPGDHPLATAAALAARLDLSHAPREPGLERTYGAVMTPNPWADPLYVHLVTHSMFQLGGNDWKKWNEGTRDPIWAKQAQAGKPSEERGSWFTGRRPGSIDGGRLYETCLNTLTLGVYYRYPQRGAELAR